MTTTRSFDYSFDVDAPLPSVAAFHRDPRALRRLTPPPLFVQLHHVEPLAEGSAADFTLWLGPLPVRWTAVHAGVDARHGFTDTQQAGPMKVWRHTHRFDALDAHTTRVREHVVYAHHGGWRGLVSRALFNPASLRLLFSYRRFVTRRAVAGRGRPNLIQTVDPGGPTI